MIGGGEGEGGKEGVEEKGRKSVEDKNFQGGSEG